MISTVTREIGGKTLTLETGRMAKQADGSVLATYGGTTALAAVVMSKGIRPGLDFFPLTVDYRERSAAAGKFPGGFFKREGRPTEKEILTARMIDRSIRPLFGKVLRNEVQVACTVLSADEENDPDIVTMIAAFAALAISNLPVKDVLGAVRVGRVDGNFVVNPTYEESEESTMHLTVAGKKDTILMVEAGMDVEPEEVVIDALEFAQQQISTIVEMVEDMVKQVGKEKLPFPESDIDTELQAKVKAAFSDEMSQAIRIVDKKDRETAIDAISEKAVGLFAEDEEDDERIRMLKNVLHDLEKELVRSRILNESTRSDERNLTTVRPISIDISPLKRTHGSALFTRGQTQSLATVTLGTVSDQQQVDTLIGESSKRFMLHYNFPPYSVGETRPIRGPGRREIGHGVLAEKSLSPMLPPEDEFPYTIRVISDILESNGSSSMASVCSASLSMMDAGVPLETAVAGIAMGLIKEGEKVAILTDILGQEDHLGDMDFKVAGTRDGITALQMDLKVEGISRELMAKALNQAREGRLHILGKMEEAISNPRDNLSPLAPRMTILHIDKSKIGDVIGPGGKTIRGIIEETGVKIDIDDDGKIVIASTDEPSSIRAVEMVNYLTEEVEVGKEYTGKVTRILNFGAFVEILPGQEGLVHISKLANQRIERVEDVVNEGDEVTVRVLEIDHMGRINLVMQGVEVHEGSSDRGRSSDRGGRQDRDRGGRDRNKRGR